MEEKDNQLKIFLRRLLILKTFFVSGIKVNVLKPYWRQKEVARVLFLSAIANLVMWGYLYANRIESDYPVILHYNLFFGVDFLGNYSLTFFLPLIGLILLLLNAVLGQIFFRIERLASYILTLNIFFIQLLLLFACVLIVRTNS